jgi:hypothetical protein
MNKNIMTAAFLCVLSIPLNAQVMYKQNFLTAFGKQPDIKNCEAAYNFSCCKSNVCAVLNAAQASLAKANEELTTLHLAVTNSATSSMTPPVNADDGKALGEKLKKMTKEEKRQWAMQNAGKYMPSAEPHVNKDIDNRPVNEAVKYIMERQENDMKDINALTETGSKLNEIEKTFKTQREKVLAKFRSVTNTTYDPSSSYVYAFGEASDQEVARFNQAVEAYKKDIQPIYNNEMKEKINCILQAEKNLTEKYTKIEEIIASTNYADDAKEPSNKLHIIKAHMSVLQNVISDINVFKNIVSDFADQYSSLMKIPSAKEINKNTK